MKIANYCIVVTCNLIGAKVSEELSTSVFLFQKMQQASLKRQHLSSKLYSIPIPNYSKFHTKPLLEDQTVHDIFKKSDYSESHEKHYDSRCAKQTFLNFVVCYFLFCTVTNKCTVISQIIILLHVSILSCRPLGACNQYLAKLRKYFKCSCW